MATVYLSNVNHKLYEQVYFENLEDNEKDKSYYKVTGGENPDLNYKQFIIEQPAIKLMITEYFFELIVKEMKYDNFHNIQYKKVDNKSFHKRLSKYKTKKIRFYYKNRWITYYFNQTSKAKVMESDIPCALAIYACYPAKGLTNFLLGPCQKEGSESGIVKCWTYDWRILANIEGLSKNEDYYIMKGKICYDPPVKYSFDLYFYRKPGENDYMIEAITVDYDKSVYSESKKTEYYILDRDGDYFIKGSTDFDSVKNMVLKRFNENPNRIELFCPQNGDRKIIATKTDKKFETFSELFKYLGRSWIGRHNAFYFQWNAYMEHFNNSNDGFYCPPKNLFGTDVMPNATPPLIPTTEYRFAGVDNDTLLQQTIEGYESRDYSIEIKEDIKILTMNDYMFFNIEEDKYSFLLDINADTIKDFNKYAVVPENGYALDSY